jgi:hypothetical protein
LRLAGETVWAELVRGIAQTSVTMRIGRELLRGERSTLVWDSSSFLPSCNVPGHNTPRKRTTHGDVPFTLSAMRFEEALEAVERVFIATLSPLVLCAFTGIVHMS